MRRVLLCIAIAMLGLGVAGDRGGPTGTATASPKDIYFCTITGTDRADHLRGTSGPDVICGGAGDDLIRGLGGGDWVWAGSGADRLFGGFGQDVLRGGDGPDVVSGLVGMDRVQGGRGRDKLAGGRGADVLLGEPQSDRLFGGAGADTLNGGSGSDYIFDPYGDNQCVTSRFDHFEYEYCAEGPNASSVELVEFSLTPQTVDTSTGPVDVAAHIRMRDPEGRLEHMNGLMIIKNLRRPGLERAGPIIRVSGDAWDSVYSTNFTLPELAPRGHYSVLFGGPGVAWGPGQLAPLGFPTGVDQIGPGDETPPQLDQVSISPLKVDTRTQDQLVNFRAHVTDDFGVGSVVAQLGAWGPFDHPVDPNKLHYSGTLDRVSGDARDGIYEGTVRLPAGTYTARWYAGVGASDTVNNGTSLGSEELVARGYPGWVDVTGG